jgi:hypothetical protein
MKTVNADPEEETRMKNRGFGRGSWILVGLMFLSTSALAQKWTLSLGGAYMGGFKVGDAQYIREVPAGANTYVSIFDNGSISASPKMNMGASFTLMYSFSKSWGVVVQVGYMPTTPVDMKMNYIFSWTFNTTDNSSSHSLSRAAKDTGDVSAVPVNLNAVWTLPLGRTTLFNISAGVTVLYTKLRLYSVMGNGVSSSAVVDDLIWKFTGSSAYDRTTKTVSWVDYYEIKLKSEEQTTSVGFNFYLDLEQKITSLLGIYLGAYYCSIGEIDATWALVPQSEFQGDLGNLDSSTGGGVDSIPPTTSRVNLSHFSAVFGLKLHF